MSEVDEVAQAIYDAHPEFFPLSSYHQALSIAVGQMPEEPLGMQQAVAQALLEINPCR